MGTAIPMMKPLSPNGMALASKALEGQLGLGRVFRRDLPGETHKCVRRERGEGTKYLSAGKAAFTKLRAGILTLHFPVSRSVTQTCLLIRPPSCSVLWQYPGLTERPLRGCSSSTGEACQPWPPWYHCLHSYSWVSYVPSDALQSFTEKKSIS